MDLFGRTVARPAESYDIIEGKEDVGSLIGTQVLEGGRHQILSAMNNTLKPSCTNSSSSRKLPLQFLPSPECSWHTLQKPYLF